MKTIFKKSHLPFLEKVLHRGQGREFWSLARTMQDKNGLQHQLSAEISLLSRAAADGDEWGMCELARNYFDHAGDLFLPQALRLWKRAALAKDPGALFDLGNRPIHDRILSYKSPEGDGYAEIEMKCALLAEWHLNAFGLSPFADCKKSEKKARCEALVREVCHILQIPEAKISLIPNLKLGDREVRGLAYWEGRIDVREELLSDIALLIAVIFHELGHLVVFGMMRGGEHGKRLQALYGISDERAASWQQNKMGYEVVTGEEDPDTLSYGVYTLWMTFFCGLNE